MPAPPVPPLLIACALGIERRALRSGLRAGVTDAASAAGPVAVVRTGMGPERAVLAVVRRLAEDRFRAAPVLATGFCAGLAPGLRPGDVVVAEAVRGEADREAVECPDNGPLLDALALLGARVHTGLLLGTDRIVRGAAARAELHARGALAADMESAAVLRAAAPAVRAGAPARRPVAAVRVVVDAPGHELVRIGTLRGGIAAYRMLSSVLSAFFEWHRNVMLPWR